MQFTLPLGLKEEKYSKSEEQRQEFEKFCLSLRAERDAIFAFVLQRFPEAGYKNPAEVSNEHWREARCKVLGLVELPEPPPAAGCDTGKRMAAKPYRPWTLERKQMERAKKLRQKALEYSAFPEIWIPWLLEKVLERPRHYGVCPLPGSCLFCPVDYTTEIRQRKAIERENLLRGEESQANSTQNRTKNK